MATYYSEHYQPNQNAKATAAVTGSRGPSVAQGRVRAKMATFQNITFATSDEVLLFKIKSSDVPLRFNIVNGDGGTDVPGTAGLYKLDGTTVDADFFTADVVLETARTSATANVAMNVPAGGDATGFFGIPIWMALGLTADPQLTYDVKIVIGTVSSGDAVSFGAFLEYLGGN